MSVSARIASNATPMAVCVEAMPLTTHLLKADPFVSRLEVVGKLWSKSLEVVLSLLLPLGVAAAFLKQEYFNYIISNGQNKRERTFSQRQEKVDVGWCFSKAPFSQFGITHSFDIWDVWIDACDLCQCAKTNLILESTVCILNPLNSWIWLKDFGKWSLVL